MTLPPTQLYPEGQFPNEKVCTRCGGDPQPLENFNVAKSGRFGRTAHCKTCIRKYKKDRTDSNLERLKTAEPPQSRICSNALCSHGGISQPSSNFGKSSSSKDGFNMRCKTCVHAAQKEYYANNRDKRKSSFRRWYDNNIEYAKEQSQKWRDEHPDWAKTTKRVYYANNKTKADASKRAAQLKKREYYNHMKKIYKRKNWAQKQVGECRRRARKKGVPFDMKASDLLVADTGAVPIFCPIFPHIKLDYNGGPDRRCWPSVDRIVPALGYVTGNVWIISFAANTWKINGSNPSERKRIVAIMNGRKKKKEPIRDQPSLFD